MESQIRRVDFTTANDSNEYYHKQHDFVSSSGLKKLKISPAHFKADQEQESEQKDCFDFGSAYHSMILEPDKFDTEFFVLYEDTIIEILISEGAKKPRATNKYKDWYMEQEDIAAGRTIIDTPTYKHIVAMRDTIYRHRYAKSLLSGGMSEQSFYCDLEFYDGEKIKCRIRPDKVNIDKRIHISLKTTRDASIRGFAKQSANFEYHISDAMYTDILEKCYYNGRAFNTIVICQETIYPYAFNMFELSNQYLGQGRYEFEQLCKLYNYCINNDKWPGYQIFCPNKYGLNVLDLPVYAVNELNFYIH